MRLLLDTHVLLWWLTDDSRLGTAARDAVASPDNVVWISPASAWEASITQAVGKLDLPEDFAETLRAEDFVELPITIADGLAAGSLPRHHDDPFDRMLVAQARARGLTIVTRDARLAEYGVEILPA